MSTGSNVGTNIKEAINICKHQLVNNDIGNDQFLILISDFDPNEPNPDGPANPDSTALDAANNAKAAGIHIFAIGFDVSGESSADETNRALGASIASPPSADDNCTASDCDHNGTDEIAAENADGDDWYLAPTADELNGVFDSIFQDVQGCPNTGTPCMEDFCNLDSRQCDQRPVEDGTECDDDNACTQGDACDEGQCVGGDPVICEEPAECKTLTCNPNTGSCEEGNRDAGTPCGDSQECDGEDSCDGEGNCVEGTPPDVCQNENPCQIGSCEEGEGGPECEFENVPDGTECGEPSACNEAPTCLGGECGAGDPVNCDDENECTDDACDEELGCVHVEIPGCGPGGTPTPSPCPDTDGDGACDGDDNCPEDANPDQVDEDGDGIGAACDGDDSGQEGPGTGGLQFRGQGCGSSNESVQVPLASAMTGPAILSLGVLLLTTLRRKSVKRERKE
jgi:hypothetical protein